MSRALQALVQRASVPGVLEASQLGIAIHALLRMDLLNVRDARVLRCVTSGTASAPPRTRASVLHALSCVICRQCVPATTLHATLSQTLLQVQDDLVDVVDALSVADSVLAMEAIIQLLLRVDLAPHLQPRLLRELQERCLALLSVAERPAELLGLLRIALEVCRSPAVVSAAEVPSTHKDTTALDAQKTTRLVRSVEDWSRTLLARTVTALQRRLDDFTRDEVLALVCLFALPMRGTHDARTAEREQVTSVTLPEAAHAVPTACRPLLLTALAHAEPELDMCTPAQLTQWLQLLRHLPPYPTLIMSLVRRISDPSLVRLVGQQGLSCPELAAAAGVLSRMLHDAPATVRDDSADVLSPVMAGTSLVQRQSAVAQAEHVDEGVVLRSFVMLLRGLVQRVEQMPRHSAEVAAATQKSLLPVLLTLPEDTLIEHCRRRQHDTGSSLTAASSSLLSLAELRAVADTLRRGCCLALRVLPQLPSQTRTAVLTLSLRWPVFAAFAPDSTSFMTMPRVEGGDSSPMFSMEREAQVQYALMQLAPLDASEAAAKQMALCKCIEHAMPDLGAAGTVAVLNDLTVFAVAMKTSAGQQRRAYAPPQQSAAASSPAVLARLWQTCGALHARVQQLPRSQLDTLSTTQLTRYLQSMSKLGMLSKSPYYRVLQLLGPRCLTPFELCVVLGVMARQQLVRGGGRVLEQTRRRLPELATALPPPLKAQLLSHWGKVYNNCGNHPALSAPPMLDDFFADAQETSRLGSLGKAFAVVGLVELRQYRSPALAWLLQELHTTHVSGATDTNAAITLHDGLEQVRSATYLAELVRSLCRLGPTAACTTPDHRGALDTVLVRAIEALREQLVRSHSLFVNLSQLTWHWPLLVWYMKTHGSVAVREAWNSLCAVSASLVRPRLCDIAHAPDLRPNTFLFNQLAIGVYLDALPQASAALTHLVHHIGTSDMAPMLGNMHQLADAVTVALYVLPPGHEKRQRVLRFVLQHAGMWGVSDVLRVWCDTTRYKTRQGERSEATSSRSEEEDDELLCQLHSVVAAFVCDEAHAVKLSPTEELLKKELLRQS